MSQDLEKYRKWIRESEYGRSKGIFYLAKGIIEELGEEKGTALVIEQVMEMGRFTGERRRKAFEDKGLENSFRNISNRADPEKSVYSFAWVGGPVSSSDEERVVEWSYCPIAEGFKVFGESGVKIGELYCNNIDNAIIQGFNPDYECVRESSLNLDGLCRLHFKLKD